VVGSAVEAFSDTHRLTLCALRMFAYVPSPALVLCRSSKLKSVTSLTVAPVASLTLPPKGQSPGQRSRDSRISLTPCRNDCLRDYISDVPTCYSFVRQASTVCEACEERFVQSRERCPRHLGPRPAQTWRQRKIFALLWKSARHRDLQRLWIVSISRNNVQDESMAMMLSKRIKRLAQVFQHPAAAVV